VAKAKGRLRGKQPKLNQRQEAHLVALLKGGEYSTAELADLFGVARSTVYGAARRACELALSGCSPGSVQRRGERHRSRGPLPAGDQFGHHKVVRFKADPSPGNGRKVLERSPMVLGWKLVPGW